MYYLLQLKTHKLNSTDVKYKIYEINDKYFCSQLRQIPEDVINHFTEVNEHNKINIRERNETTGQIITLIQDILNSNIENSLIEPISTVRLYKRSEYVKKMGETERLIDGECTIPNFTLTRLDGEIPILQNIPMILPQKFYETINNCDIDISHIAMIDNNMCISSETVVYNELYFKSKDGATFKTDSRNIEYVPSPYKVDHEISLDDFYTVGNMIQKYKEKIIFRNLDYVKKEEYGNSIRRFYRIDPNIYPVYDTNGDELLLIRSGQQKNYTAVLRKEFLKLYTPL